MSSTSLSRTGGTPSVLITGGAGFIGTNLSKRLADQGVRVLILDSLARAGSEANIEWLLERFPTTVEFRHEDIRDPRAVSAAVSGVQHVYHLAAQVAVTTSLLDPEGDFEVNARGTLSLLEAVRACPEPPSLIYASTNKVYGGLSDIELAPLGKRYVPCNEHTRTHGIDETRSLDFHSPYGCSKGAADQYVLDYARSFGLATLVFRMSCIYGPHQHGNEDQGWVAHFLRRVLAHEAVSVYGDGMQVRDLLFIDDLVDAFELARRHIYTLPGRVFNLGGGPRNAASVLEVLDHIERLTGHSVQRSMHDWRVGDQRYYVSDTTSLSNAVGWHARMDVSGGIAALHAWYHEQAHGARSIVREITRPTHSEAHP